MTSSEPRAVTWRGLILTAALLLLTMSLLAIAGGYWAWTRLAARVLLQEQRAQVELPAELAVRAAVGGLVEVKLDQSWPVRVPVRQTFQIPLTDPIALQASIDTVVPLAVDVAVEHTLQVDQVIAIDAKVATRFMGMPLTVPIKGQVPVKAAVPISLVIPVRKQVPLSLTVPATVRLAEPIEARVDTVVETRVPLRETLRVPVTAPVAATLTFPQQVTEAGLKLIDFELPLDAIRLVPRPEVGAKEVKPGRASEPAREPAR